jgi:hypothetical protein
MKTPSTLRVTALSVATFAALSGAQTAHAQSIWDVLKAKAPGLASVMQAVVVNNSQAPTVVVQPQASAATQVPAAAATPAPQASPVASAAPAATATTPAPSPAAQAGNGLKKGFEAMTNRRPAETSELPKHAKAQSGVVGNLDVGAMSASTVALTLADGSVIEARMQRVANDGRNNAQSWIGTFDDAPGSILVISKAKGVVTGFANYKDQVFELVPSSGGKHLLFRVDESSLPKSDGFIREKKSAGDTTGSSAVTSSSTTLGAGDTLVHDVLVVYTAASASAYGQASLESMIQSAVQSANQAYLNSQVGITMNLVGTQQVAITESGAAETTLSKLQSDAAVRTLRDQLNADLVLLVSQDSNWCGYANLMTSNSTSFAGSAYGVVYSACLSNQSLAHEAGHLQGLDHDRANSAGGGVYGYSYGFRRCVSDGTGFRDIMSYSCSGAPRVLLFSNPNVTYNGYAAGIAYESDPSNSAENARTLNNTAATVAAFRGASSGGGGTTSSTPSSPSGLNATSVTSSSVSLTWSDNATNETGYKLERSPDGVNFTELATLGADAKSFSDSTVSSRSNYSYRVLAYNSAGMSDYSNSVQVTTPDPIPPPTAPASVSAMNGGNGTATVSWAASSSTSVTAYEVLREKWDSRKLVWGGATVVATVQSNVLSVIDRSNSGTFRYSVRAANSSGKSGYAGPAAVMVTGKTTGRK